MSVARPLTSRALLLLLALTAALGLSRPARADGGHIAFHATQGPYTITLFTAPEPLVTGPSELSLLVQDASTDQPLPDAVAQASLEQAGAGPSSVHFSRSSPANPLLLLAAPALASPGAYTLTLFVSQTGRATSQQRFTVRFNVTQDHGRRTTLLFGLGLPVLAVLLFLVNQNAKERVRSRSSAAL